MGYPDDGWTDSDIREIRSEAKRHRDWELVRVCNWALTHDIDGCVEFERIMLTTEAKLGCHD